MYGCHYLNKETTFDNKMHLMSLGFAFQFPDLVIYSLEKYLYSSKNAS